MTYRQILCGLLAVVLLAAAQAAQPSKAFQQQVNAAQDGTPSLVPSWTPSPIPSVTSTAYPTNTPRVTATMIPTIARTTISTLIPGPFGGESATWTPPAPGRFLSDHYFFRRPIGDNFTNYWAGNYSYGSTDNGSRPVHHGLDFPDEAGTPVLAVAQGTVYYGGSDIPTMFGPQLDFYGNVVVIQHNFTDSNGQPVYSLYGHLSKVDVVTGQHVKAGDQIGLVGSAGVALGAHLHLEVRVGNPRDYNSTRNPELWIVPFSGNGVIAGRVMDLNGVLLPGITVEAQSPTGYRMAYTYGDNTTPGDTAMGENFVIPELSAGYYTVFVKTADGTLRFRRVVYVFPGRTNWIDINVNLGGF
jgi:murein DD-endopeptidase MepM/ murein hydrolase activator NlpD